MAVKKKEAKAKKKEEKPVINLSNKQERQIKIAVVFMAILIITVLFFYWLSLELKKFEYAGAKFEKTKQGQLDLYLAKFPVQDSSGNTWYSPFYFREDPRKLTRININGAINLKRNVALAADSFFVEHCEDSILAGTTLSVFIKQMGMNPFPATTDGLEAMKLNRQFVDCTDNPDYSVVVFENGNQSAITKQDNCYILTSSNNCEVMNVSEKFMIGYYANSQGLRI